MNYRSMPYVPIPSFNFKQLIKYLTNSYDYRTVYPIIDTVQYIEQKEKPQAYHVLDTKSLKRILPNEELTYDGEFEDKLVIENKTKTHIISQQPHVQAWIKRWGEKYIIYEDYSVIPHINHYNMLDGVTLVKIS